MPGNQPLAVFYAFYSSGALVFGGGHVILPLLNSQVVSPGWVTNSQFLAGYGLTQAMPGPLSTFSAYLGTVLERPPSGIVGGFYALFSIFLPSFLLVYGPLPFWNSLRKRRSFQSVLNGINAGVVGILLAALYNPIFVTSVFSLPDFLLVILLGVLLIVLKRPPWNIVLVAALGGLVIGLLGLA
jgi:chromate transporter